MVFKLGIVLASPFILLAVMMGASGVVVVDVRKSDLLRDHPSRN